MNYLLCGEFGIPLFFFQEGKGNHAGGNLTTLETIASEYSPPIIH